MEEASAFRNVALKLNTGVTLRAGRPRHKVAGSLDQDCSIAQLPGGAIRFMVYVCVAI